ncbi:MAG TPA: SGNH/GDSL hydrolase family protein [Myxococcota bacterium]|nr:SGNH/GDSL hydrolase family protein [Myxococcota bacterium]
MSLYPGLHSASRGPARTRLREIAFRAVAVVLGVTLPLGIAEGTAAWLIQRDNHRYKAYIPEAVEASVNFEDRHIPTQPDPYLSYRVQPNLAGERVQTNEYGLREGPIDRRPAPGTTRILFLGASVVWGYLSKSNADTIPSYLEAELARRADEVPELRGRRFEVLNAGVPGYVSWQEALSYAIYLRELAPAWIISLDGANDVAAAIINGRAGVPSTYRASERAYLGFTPDLLEAFHHWLLLFASRELRSVRVFERLRPKPLSAYGPPPPDEVAAQLREATAYLNHAATRERARVFTVLQPMVILPDTKPLTEFEARIVVEQDHRMPGRNAYFAQSYAAMRSALAALQRERGGDLLWLDATDAYANTTEIAYTDDCHLTPIGQRRLAQRIAEGWIAALHSPALMRQSIAAPGDR